MANFRKIGWSFQVTKETSNKMFITTYEESDFRIAVLPKMSSPQGLQERLRKKEGKKAGTQNYLTGPRYQM